MRGRALKGMDEKTLKNSTVMGFMPLRAFLAALALSAGLLACDGMDSLKDKADSAKGDEDSDTDDESLPVDTEVLVFGDSLSTGALTHPAVSLDPGDVLSRASKGEIYPIDLSLIGEGLKEGQGNYEAYRFRIQTENESGIFSNYIAQANLSVLNILETSAYSWVSQLAALQGTDATKTADFAVNGAETHEATEEVEHYIAHAEKEQSTTLPREVYFFFSGNDLCRGEEDSDKIASAKEYVAGLREGIETLLRGTEANAKGTKIHLVGHLNVLQFAEGDALEKKIVVGSDMKEQSCIDYIKSYSASAGEIEKPEDLRPEANEKAYHPLNFCHTLLSQAKGTGLEPSIEASVLQERLADYRKGAEALVKELADSLEKDFPEHADKVGFDYLKSTHDLKFEADDLANDCFHLSVDGQRKVAEAIAGELGK